MQSGYNTKTLKKIAIGFGVFVVICIIAALLSLTNKESIDQRPEEGTDADYSQQARIVNGEKLFVELEGGDRYDYFARDIKEFAKRFEEYSEKPVTGFEITSDLEVDGSVIKFDGKYGSVNNKISVTLEKLNNQRLKTSITDSSSNVTVDDDTLPSNSLRNQFVATLPLDSPYCTVTFVVDGEIINAELKSLNEADKAACDQFILQQTGGKDIGYSSIVPTYLKGEGVGLF